MPRGIPEIGKEEWFRLPAKTRRNLVARWLDKVIGARRSRATWFLRREIYRHARRRLGVKKLPPEVKRDINRLIEQVD